MKKIILPFLFMITFLAPATHSFGKGHVTVNASKLPRKVQQSYDSAIGSLASSLYFYGAMPSFFLESTTKNSDHNYVFTVSFVDINGVVPDQSTTIVISPNGEIIEWPGFYIPA